MCGYLEDTHISVELGPSRCVALRNCCHAAKHERSHPRCSWSLLPDVRPMHREKSEHLHRWYVMPPHNSTIAISAAAPARPDSAAVAVAITASDGTSRAMRIRRSSALYAWVRVRTWR